MSKAKLIKACNALRKRQKRAREQRKLSPIEYTRKYFPDLDDSGLSGVIFGLTGWPSFWHIPRDGKTPKQCFKKSIRRAAAMRKRGISINQQLSESWDQPLCRMHIEELTKLIERLRGLPNEEAAKACLFTGYSQAATESDVVGYLQGQLEHYREWLEREQAQFVKIPA